MTRKDTIIERWIPAGLALLICLLGWFVFLYHLEFESMWYDERISWKIGGMGLVELFQRLKLSVHPPLYFLGVHAWMRITQSQDLFIMRLTSVFPAALAVAMAYRVGTDWFKSRWAGVGSAAVLATSGIFIYYARELRMYSLLVLLILVSWWCFWRFVTTGRRSTMIAYAVSVALLAYTYYFAAFIVLIQGVVLLLYFRERLRAALLAYIMAGVSLIPWLPSLLYQIRGEAVLASGDNTFSLSNVGKVSATEPTTWRNIGYFIELYTANQQGYVLLIVVLALGIALTLKQKPGIRRWVIASALWLLATPVIVFTLNIKVGVYAPRYLLGIIPALGLLAGVIVTRLSTLTGRLLLIGGFVVVGLTFHTAGFRELKTPHGDLFGAVLEGYQPGDRIWYNMDTGAMGSSLWMEVEDYYLVVVYPELGNTDMYIWDAPNDFANVAENPRIWDIRPYWIDMPGDVADVLLDGRALIQEEYIHGYSVRLYDAPPQDHEPTVFDESIMMQVAPVDEAAAPGEGVNLLSWWRTTAALDRDYSLGLYLRQSDGAVVAQADAGLTAGDRPSSQWEPDGDYAPLQTAITIPADLPDGDYEVWLSVYYWEGPAPLPITAAPDVFPTQTEPPLVQIGTITVSSAAE